MEPDPAQRCLLRTGPVDPSGLCTVCIQLQPRMTLKQESHNGLQWTQLQRTPNQMQLKKSRSRAWPVKSFLICISLIYVLPCVLETKAHVFRFGEPYKAPMHSLSTQRGPHTGPLLSPVTSPPLSTRAVIPFLLGPLFSMHYTGQGLHTLFSVLHNNHNIHEKQALGTEWPCI